MTEQYPDHGRHLAPFYAQDALTVDALIEEACASEEFGRWPCPDIVNGGEKEESVLVHRTADARLGKQFLLVTHTQGDRLALLGAYPLLLDGITAPAVIKRIQPWPYGIEGWVHAAVTAESAVVFFDTMFFAGSAGLQPGAKVNVCFAALAYKMRRAENTRFQVTQGPMLGFWREQRLQRGESPEEASRPVVFDMSEAAIYLPRGGDTPDEAEFQGVAEKLEHLKHGDESVYRVELVLTRTDDATWRIPVYATARALDGYIPTVGDTVRGYLWLQGRIVAETDPGARK